MNRPSVTLIALAVALTTATSATAPEKDCSKWSVKGVQVGMTLEEVLTVFPGEPMELQHGEETRYIWTEDASLQRVTVGSQKRALEFSFSIEDAEITQDELWDALVEKWGDPADGLVWHDPVCDVGVMALRLGDKAIDLNLFKLSWRLGVVDEEKKEKAKRAREVLEKPRR